MRLFTSLIAAVATVLVAGAASAALNVSSPQSGGIVAAPGDLITIDIQISTTAPEALALGLRAADYDPSILTTGTATLVPASIFNFAPSVPFGGLTNSASGVEEAPGGPRPGTSINLFQGVALSPAAGAGPENFQVTFVAGVPGITTVAIGALGSYGDIYAGGDNVANNTSVQVTVVPEPGTALLMGLGLAGLAAAGRKE